MRAGIRRLKPSPSPSLPDARVSVRFLDADRKCALFLRVQIPECLRGKLAVVTAVSRIRLWHLSPAEYLDRHLSRGAKNPGKQRAPGHARHRHRLRGKFSTARTLRGPAPTAPG